MFPRNVLVENSRKFDKIPIKMDFRNATKRKIQDGDSILEPFEDWELKKSVRWAELWHVVCMADISAIQSQRVKAQPSCLSNSYGRRLLHWRRLLERGV